MGNYRLTESAEDDLIGIHQWGVRTYGVVQADKYYDALFDRFEQIAEEPYLYPAVDHIHIGYRRSVCGADSIYYKIERQGIAIMRVLSRQNLDKAL